MKRTGAQILIETLIEQGADTVFGYPGGQILPVYDELYKNRHRLSHITTCHEQGAAHAADGYARVTGKVGVCMATSGPGATNLVTGIATAYLDSTPMVAITGNVATSLLGRDSFQEVDIAGIAIPITKHSVIVKDVDDLANTVRQAFAIAKSGRPGPVLIDVPRDVQVAESEYEPMPPVKKSKPPLPSPKDFEDAAALIASACRPYIYTGGGTVIANASAALAAFCEKIDAPVGSSMMGLSAIAFDNPHFLGMVGMHGKYAASNALYQSDLIIAVGVRFSDRATGKKSEFAQGRKVIQIDIDAAEIGKNIPADVGLIGDVQCVLQNLLERVPSQKHPDWNQRVQSMKDDPKNSMDMGNSRLTPQHVIEAACKFNGDNPVATDVGQHQMWTTQYYGFKKPRTFITSGGLGTMGFGLGAAIGACIGTEKKTLLITSDGCFHMNLNELATAVSHNLPIVVVLLNNGVLGMVRQWQTLFYDKRYSCTSLERKTDYVKLAESFGAKGLRAETKAEFDEKIQEAFAQNGPVVLDCRIDSDEQVLPMIPPGSGINDIILR